MLTYAHNLPRTVQFSLVLGRSHEVHVSRIYSNVDFMEFCEQMKPCLWYSLFFSVMVFLKRSFFVRKMKKDHGMLYHNFQHVFWFFYSLHCAREPVHYHNGWGDAESPDLPYPGGLAQTQVRCSPLYSHSTQKTLLYLGILSHVLAIISTKHYYMYMYMSL